MKKLLFVLMLSALVMGVTFAGGDKEKKTGKDEVYTLKVFSDTQEITNSSQTTIGKIIKEKFNVELEYIPYSGDYREMTSLMLASGDYPELLWIQRSDILKQYIDAGVAQPLDQYLDDMPNFRERFKVQIPYWRLASSDGKLYNWDHGVPQDSRMRVDVLDIAIRSDVLKEAGYPSLLSSDDYIDFLEEAMKKNPTTNGRKTFGLVFPGAEPWGLQGLVPIMYEKGEYNPPFAGNNAVIWDTRSEQFVDFMKNFGVKESYHFFNKLYRKGLIDRENFTDHLPQTMDKANSGQALAVWYVIWPLGTANASLVAAGHPEMQYVNLPIQSPTQVAEKQKRALRIETTRDFNSYIITDKARYPKRIMEVLDFFASEEGQILQQSGVEGIHYTIENGKRTPTQTMIEQVKSNPVYLEREGLAVGSSFAPFGFSHATAKDGLGYRLLSDPEYSDMFIEESAIAVYKEMGWSNSQEWWVDNGTAAETLITNQVQIDPNSKYGLLQNRLVEFRVKQSARLVTEPKNDAEFEAMYNQIITEYEKLGPEVLIDKYNDLLKELTANLKL